MFEALFGNRTAAAALTFIAANGDAYAQEIADETGITLSLVQQQLRRLERGGVLVSRLRGRVRLYSLNPRWPFVRELEEMLTASLDYLPDREREVYVKRRRPRARGKRL